LIITLTNNKGKISKAPDGVPDLISDECSFEVRGAEKSELYKKKRWDGRKRLYDKVRNEFPIGLWQRVRSLLNRSRLEYEVVDNRKVPDRHLDLCVDDVADIRTYQREAVIAAISTGQAVVRAATGAGKTYIAAQLIAQVRCNTLFMVHTKDLLHQAKTEIRRFLNTEVGQIGDGVVDVRPVTVATMQTVAKYMGVKIVKDEFDETPEYKDNTQISGQNAAAIEKAIKGAGMVIWDEVHRVACDTASGVMDGIVNAYYRIGLSASPWRDDGADMMIEAAMGHTCYSVSASELIKQGYLVQPIIRRVSVPASQPWYEDTRAYDTIYKQEIVENDARNELILKYASDFMEMGIPFLILVQQIKHGEYLRKLITERYHPMEFISGRDFTEKRLGAIQGMREGEIHGLIASTIADEGLDIKRLAGLILAGGGKSSTRALQRVGRVLRPFEGKTHAIVIDMADESKYLRVHSAKRKEIYLTEPEFVILET